MARSATPRASSTMGARSSEAVVTSKRDEAAALKGSFARQRVRSAPPIGTMSPSPRQLGRGFAPAISTQRGAAVSKYEDATKVRFSSCPSPQSLQQERHRVTRHITTGRSATRRPRGIAPLERRARHASTNRRYFDKAFLKGGTDEQIDLRKRRARHDFFVGAG
jgi:hypothetical protein